MPVTPGIWIADDATYRPDRYYRYADLTTLLHSWVDQHPHLLSIGSIGKTWEGRDIWALTLADRSTGAPADKPAYFVDANIHADEITGVATVLWLLNHVLTTHQTDPAIGRLLAEITMNVVPAINVDGMEACMAGDVPFIRSSMRPFPLPDQQDGLVEQDIDGDGTVLTMRIKDPAGPWRASRHDPRIMTRRGTDEQDGDFYFLLPEGLIQNWDGGNIAIAPDLRSIDANRNYPAEWAPHWEQYGAGDYPLSEPETKAIADFLLAHPNIHGSQHFHTWSAVILRPPTGYPTGDMPFLDQAVFKAIGALGEEETGYPCIGIFDDFAYDKKKPYHGGLIDWAYQQVGIIPYSTELWSLPLRAGVAPEEKIDFFKVRDDADDTAMLHMLDRELEGEGYREWTPFAHPQLGPVEIGGWDRRYTWTNPPGAMLEEVTAPNARFVLRAATTAPRLELRDAHAERLGADLYRLTVVIHNVGFLPTYVTEMARAAGVTKPVVATIETGEGGAVVSGEVSTDLGHLEGRANLLGQILWSEAASVRNRAVASWVVQQLPGSFVSITAATAKAGKVSCIIALSGFAEIIAQEH